MSDLPQLSRREREIMDSVFALGEATVKDIEGRLREPPTRQALRSLLDILVQKQQLKRLESRGREVVYAPVVTKGHAAISSLRQVLQTFFGGKLSEAAAAYMAAPGEAPDAAELAELRKLIADAESHPSPPHQEGPNS